MSPPFRDKSHQDSLWAGLAAGSLQVVATDHCAFTTEQKRTGLKDFTKIPNGTGGLEDRLSVLWTKGVVTGRLTVKKFVEVTSTNIARILVFNNPLAKFAIECNSHARKAYKVQTGEDGISLPDPVAMSIALDPSIGIDWSEHYIDIETQSELTRGMTVVDRLNVAADDRNQAVWAAVLEKKAKARICWTMDNQRWKAALFSALR
jgi:hypothetical protein